MEQVGDRMREIKFRYRVSLGIVGTDEVFEIHKLNMSKIDDLELLLAIMMDDYRNIVSSDQYTGLKDKNVREIYEGDIITAHSEYNTIESGIVKWDNKEASFRAEQGISVGTSFYGFQQIENIEIIGNIYENPDR